MCSSLLWWRYKCKIRQSTGWVSVKVCLHNAMCTLVEMFHNQSSEEKCPECANDINVEADVDWIWKTDLSSILSKSLGLIQPPSFRIWLDSSSYSSSATSKLSSSVPVHLFLLESSSVLLPPSMIAGLYSVLVKLSVHPLASNLRCFQKFAKTALIRLDDCTEGFLEWRE